MAARLEYSSICVLEITNFQHSHLNGLELGAYNDERRQPHSMLCERSTYSPTEYCSIRTFYTSAYVVGFVSSLFTSIRGRIAVKRHRVEVHMLYEFWLSKFTRRVVAVCNVVTL